MSNERVALRIQQSFWIREKKAKKQTTDNLAFLTNSILCKMSRASHFIYAQSLANGTNLGLLLERNSPSQTLLQTNLQLSSA
jgi:hypothetical protein